MIWTILRTLLLLFSCYGYLQWLSKKLKAELALGVLFTGIGSVMFLAGILNLLLEAAIVILLCGVGLAIASIFKKQSPKALLTPGMIFFACSAVLLFALFYGSKFTRYDDFSHWATVVKLLLEKDRFPNFSDSNIMFQSYPVGSSVFIYYIARMVGTNAEWVQMYAQSLCMTGLLSALFCFTKKIYSILLACAMCVILLASNGILTSLLVDTLLPLIAVSAMAMVIDRKEELSSYLLYTVPYTVFLMSVKNSGIFFVIIILCYLLCTVKIKKADLVKWGITVAAPFLTLMLWQKHVKLVFEDGLQAKHSMSVEHFQTIFAGKTVDDLKTILSGIADKMFSLENGFYYLLLLGICLFVVGKYLFQIKTGQAVVLSVCSYIGYQIGLLGMYLFTMPLEEALVLASYDRYHNTVLIFICGLLGIMSLQLIEQFTKDKKGHITAAAVLLCFTAVMFGSLKPDAACYRRQVLAGSERAYFDALIAENNLEAQKSYMLVIDAENPNASYLRFMGKYLLSPENIKVRVPEKVGKLEKVATTYDYLVLYDRTDAVLQWWEETVGESAYVVAYDTQAEEE